MVSVSQRNEKGIPPNQIEYMLKNAFGLKVIACSLTVSGASLKVLKQYTETQGQNE